MLSPRASSDCARPPFSLRCKVIQDYEEVRKSVGLKTERLIREQERAAAEGRSVSCAGKSIIEMLQDRLDLCIYTLMTDWVGKPPANDEEREELLLLKGRAQGLTEALTIFDNPYYPDQQRIKNEAMLRYEARIAEEEEEDGEGTDDGE